MGAVGPPADWAGPTIFGVSEVDRHWGLFAGVSWPGFASSLVGGGGCLVACVGPDQAVVPGIVSGILA